MAPRSKAAIVLLLALSAASSCSAQLTVGQNIVEEKALNRAAWYAVQQDLQRFLPVSFMTAQLQRTPSRLSLQRAAARCTPEFKCLLQPCTGRRRIITFAYYEDADWKAVHSDNL